MIFNALNKIKNTAQDAVDRIPDPAEIYDQGMAQAKRISDGVSQGFVINIQGIEIEIDGNETAELLYNAIVPQVAQAVLRGELPTKNDFRNDAIAWAGGPIEGVYVAANSESAKIIASGGTPPAEQLGMDMVRALTPVAKRRLGL